MALIAPLALYAQITTVTGRVEFTSPGATKSKSVAPTFVWLMPLNASGEEIAATNPPPTGPPPRLVQRKKSFSPHLLVVPVGTAVDFPNHDPFFHNVFSLFEGKRFDLGLYEAGATRTVVFNRVGISYIFCNIHPEMSAVVIALKTPYYGISDRAGTIAIPNVPAGRYELHVW